MVVRKAKISDVKNIIRFIHAANRIPCDLDIHCGRNYLDAKSAMGVMTINVRNEFLLEIHTENPEEIAIAERELAEFLIE